MKRLINWLMILCLVVSWQIPAFAAGGFFETGGYTVTDPSYTMMCDEAVLVYNKELTYDEKDGIEYSDIMTGSDLYVPIYVYDREKDTESHATAKKIKDDNVEVSYKEVVGGRYIDSISIVDGKKEKIGLSGGAYVKIEFSDLFMGNSRGSISVKIVLSVNKVAYQESRVSLECDIINRLEYIDLDSVYGAQVPTKFRVGQHYYGEATFDMGDGIKYTARVTKNASYIINFDREPDYDIDLMYPDAYLQFYNFRGDNDTFASIGKLVIPVYTASFRDSSGQPRVYAYEILSGKQLRAIGSDEATYDSRAKQLTIRTQTLGNYVLSNQKLQQTVQEEEDNTFQYGFAEPGAGEAQVADEVSAQQSSGGAAATATTAAVAAAPSVEGTSAANVIYASNTSGDNPPTGPARFPIGFILLLGVVGSAAYCLWDRRRR